MRFNLNETYVFFMYQIQFTGHKTPIPKPHAFPTLDLDCEILDVKFIEAKCVEHHKVGWDQDPESEKKYDGFVFEYDGMKGHNQYPCASYGQMSDGADRMVSFMHHYYESLGQSFEKLDELDVYFEYQLFSNHIAKLEQAIQRLQKESVNDKSIPKLVARKELFLGALKEQLGMEVEIFPHEFKKTDGSKVSYPEILDARVIRK